MPHSTTSRTGIASVDEYAAAVQDLLRRAREVKQDADIEPALNLSDLGGAIEAIGDLSQTLGFPNIQAHNAAIETAVRDAFYDLLVRKSSFIHKPWLIPCPGLYLCRSPCLQ